jgi:hypothetical protein
MEPWAIAIMSFLGGALLTAFGYTLLYSGKIATLETTVKNLVDAIKSPPTPKELTRVCAQVESIEKRVEKLEASQ